jgi:hypothetical protein
MEAAMKLPWVLEEYFQKGLSDKEISDLTTYAVSSIRLSRTMRQMKLNGFAQPVTQSGTICWAK